MGAGTMLCSWSFGTAELRVQVKTPVPPVLGKERFDGKAYISVCRPHPSFGSGFFVQ
jgi:hypothetical protein